MAKTLKVPCDNCGEVNHFDAETVTIKVGGDFLRQECWSCRGLFTPGDVLQRQEDAEVQRAEARIER